MGFDLIRNAMQETLMLLLANKKGTEQPAHPYSLISAFIVRYLKSKRTRSDVSQFSIIFFLLFYVLGGWGLQHDKSSGYARGIQYQLLQIQNLSRGVKHILAKWQN